MPPLWVVGHTSAPKALVAVLMVVNTGVVIGFQVLVARRVTTPAAAVRASVLSGVLLLLPLGGPVRRRGPRLLTAEPSVIRVNRPSFGPLRRMNGHRAGPRGGPESCAT